MTFRPEMIHPDTWPAIFGVLKPAIERGADATVPELIDDLLVGNAQLWVLREGGDPKAVAVTELALTPLGRVVHGRLLGGKGMARWVDNLIDCIVSHAVVIGAVEIRIIGRMGWERVLGARGWQRSAVVMSMALQPQMAGASHV